MTSQEFQRQLARRAAAAGIEVSAELSARLEDYYRLLAHWNASINLTALPLNPITDQALDRLLIEPLAAAGCVSTESPIWFDVGSGGGSPAIPLKLAKPDARLTMVESKERKAAFLREAIRLLNVEHASVEVKRIEEMAANAQLAGTADLVTVRAVRVDSTLLAAIQTLLRLGGQTLFFGARRAEFGVLRGLEVLDRVSGGPSPESQKFIILHRVSP
jgi:16S rRNA (guanine527-N7)-methyltransferase